MEILKWRDTYETGVEQMDSQHKRLIKLVNQMYGIIRAKEGHEELDQILNEMSKYAKQHLGDEEHLLEEHEYPGLAAQQKSHQEYFSKMDELLVNIETDREAAAQQIYVFLRQWWIDHIVGEDKEYGEFLNKKGVH